VNTNLYALRDRLLNYYMQPFAAPTDQDAQAAISFNINAKEIRDAVSQAPHHFEVWRLAKIEEGDIYPSKEFLCDCSSLVRNSIRDDLAGSQRAAGATEPNEGNPRSAPSARGAENRPVPHPAQG